MSLTSNYRGRFAPSPTGPLHFGSLVAAMGSYLQAKHQKGEWLVRIDDIDPPREQKGAANDILRTLEGFGFEWDNAVQYQSNRLKRYQEAVHHLLEQHLAYPCSCSRKSILKKTGQIKGETIYPGFCRNGPLEKRAELSSYSIRLRCNSDEIQFNDSIQGPQAFSLEILSGDFILQRQNGYFSYQLASGIDDAEQKITEVIRGADLLSCTPSQIHVQRMLNLSSPGYCHLPVAVNDEGQKLSKQSHAPPLEIKDSIRLLYKTLKFLGQMPPIQLMNADQEAIWNWAIKHWQLNLVPQNKPKKTIQT